MATDSEPNCGLLSDTHDADKVYKRIGGILVETSSSLSILKWSADESAKVKEEDSFIRFKKAYSEHV